MTELPPLLTNKYVDPDTGEFFDHDNFLPADRVEINFLKTVNRLLKEEKRHDQKFPAYLTSNAWNEDMERRIAEGQAVGIIFMDFDGFKNINDELGHDIGDDLIERFGEYMNEVFRREEDSVGIARWGGDEFGISFRIDDDDRRTTDIEERLEKTAAYFREHIAIFIDKQPNKEELIKRHFGVSFGVTFYDPHNPRPLKELQKEVDQKMYHDKKERKRAQRKTRLAQVGKKIVDLVRPV